MKTITIQISDAEANDLHRSILAPSNRKYHPLRDDVLARILRAYVTAPPPSAVTPTCVSCGEEIRFTGAAALTGQTSRPVC